MLVIYRAFLTEETYFKDSISSVEGDNGSVVEREGNVHGDREFIYESIET